MLDLIGLAYYQEMRTYRTSSDPGWMDKMAQRHGVKLAMIYDPFFPELPPNWQAVGKLYLGRRKLVVGGDPVTLLRAG